MKNDLKVKNTELKFEAVLYKKNRMDTTYVLLMYLQYKRSVNRNSKKTDKGFFSMFVVKVSLSIFLKQLKNFPSSFSHKLALVTLRKNDAFHRKKVHLDRKN